MDITAQATLSNGRVVTLMGNHEYMDATGDLRYFAKRDALNYKEFAKPNSAPKEIVTNAFCSQNKIWQVD